MASHREGQSSGHKLAEMERLSNKKALSFCTGRVPVYVNPSFYRALKLKYPLHVGGVSRDGRVTTELSTGSLKHAVGILTPRISAPWSTVGKVSGFYGSKPCHFEFEETEGSR